MPVQPEPTPNPNAMKFTVGAPVGGPSTHTPANPTDDPVASQLLALDGVTSVFMTADFVTLSKSAEGDWGSLVPAATEILERHYG